MANNTFRLSMVMLALWMAVPRTACSCTALCLLDGRRPVVARNYDWHIGEGLVITNKKDVSKVALTYDRPAKWTSAYGSLTFNQYGREFPCGGMNEAGLVVTVLWLDDTRYPRPDGRPSISTLQWVQYQLDTSATVADVVASDERIRIQPVSGTKVHYFVADKQGGCAVVEFLDGRMVAHTADSLPVRAVANSVYAEALDDLNGYAGFGGSRSLDARAKRNRFLHAADLAKSYAADPATPAVSYALQALDAVAQGSFTKWSIVYDPANSTVHFRTRAARSVRTVNLSQFDFSTDTPVKVLDINADLRGDVADHFVDYTRQQNRDLIAQSLAKTGMLRRMPGITVDLIATYPETCGAAEREPEPVESGR